ncbi:MAG TPA: hypothetical protein IAA98_11320 [Candidatus Avipropionibacterium avicola]|uniref:VOC domain-containing protein n=1 Tax=Candidatus Avipropionibacterium avicola TaxID=2840701 RepID=A0A9D1GZA3_9ACTN|nr:hypothetical protein [Candidatus Avipropionibacterium avicola]
MHSASGSDEVTARLRAAGIDHGEPTAGGDGRIMPVTDPDGNQLVFCGT